MNSGGNGAQSAINGGFHVSEIFTEARLPVLNDLPAAYDLSFDAGYRYSKYTSGFDTNTYKFGVEYAPIKDVKLRGGYNHAVRAPSVGDLFSPAVIEPAARRIPAGDRSSAARRAHRWHHPGP